MSEAATASSRPQRIRVMLADDHEIVRQGLRTLIATVPDVDIVDEVGDAETAVAHTRTLSPDLIVLDLSMPKASGLNAIRTLRGEDSPPAIVVFTRHRDPSFARDALSAGASGYVLKQSPFSELERAITHAARGEKYVDPQLAPHLGPTGDRSHRVSERETEVLRRASLGQSNKDIAAALNIAVKTVEVHKTQGMRKLDLRDRQDLIRYATMQGWLFEP